MRYFVGKIEEMLKYQEDLYINSDDILEYLRNNKNYSLMLKNILDDELVFIKKYRKDTMEGWKYYKEFVEICKTHRRIDWNNNNKYILNARYVTIKD